ncbi:MAG: agmatine deiminase family protein [Rhodanobacteraceae bacterium]|nr:agmatine deiminase family protein [Rhodanobacteraceae bacterium]MBK7042324.1 agmatine deiminase family protein [Rhodanobacteraceae bacterium]MBP9154794.1 agmatine deiminase family protein [Xanthomonadales bacterium]HQW80815.1 agmatine deiminase family protein [Pseudomonadota bacterium]
MNDAAWQLPAEWERQSAVLIAWPHASTDWAANLADVESTYVALATAVARFQHLRIVVANTALSAHVRARLTGAGVDMTRVRLIIADYDDTWLRDSGPITQRDNNRFRLLDFHFTGWGGKFGASRDDRLIGALHAAGMFQNAEHARVDFALEGGAIEVDGNGTLMSTLTCLHQRHPALDEAGLGEALGKIFSVAQVVLLKSGELQGDDTDAHIDTLARFAPDRTIVFQSCDDESDPHHASLTAMRNELAAMRDVDGHPYRLLALPWAKPIHAADGRRLAASYANFLIINDALLMPAYGDCADAEAKRALARAFPDREIVAIPARALIEQNGSLHCITMQLPDGVIDVA